MQPDHSRAPIQFAMQALAGLGLISTPGRTGSGAGNCCLQGLIIFPEQAFGYALVSAIVFFKIAAEPEQNASP